MRTEELQDPSENQVVRGGGPNPRVYNYGNPVLPRRQWDPFGGSNVNNTRTARNEEPDMQDRLGLGGINNMNLLMRRNDAFGPSSNRLEHMRVSAVPYRMHIQINPNRTQVSTPVNSPNGLLTNLMTGVSRNYLGDPFLKANQSANIPDELNTSVWITNLPPELDYKMLLDSVRNCGKIFATVINGPNAKHTTSACKLVFFDVAGANNLLHQARRGQFHVGGYMPSICRNRIKTEAKPPCPNSRVLHIEGPRSIINQPCLEALFHSDGITWQNEEILTLYITESHTRLEWRFGSYRCQAESARNLIERVKKREMMTQVNSLWQSVTVHFGVDPCAPNSLALQTFRAQAFQRPGTQMQLP